MHSMKMGWMKVSDIKKKTSDDEEEEEEDDVQSKFYPLWNETEEVRCDCACCLCDNII